MTAARSISFRLNGAPVTADVKPLHHFGLWVGNIDGTKQEMDPTAENFIRNEKASHRVRVPEVALLFPGRGHRPVSKFPDSRTSRRSPKPFRDS